MSSNPLRIVVGHRPPLVFVTNNTDGVVYSGLLIDLWERIVSSSNGAIGSFQYYVTPANVGGVYNVTEGVWTGVMGEIVYGRADLALFPLARTGARSEAIDCTYSYLDEGFTLLVSNVKENPGALSVLAPFEMTLWITLLCTVICVALLFWALDAYGRWIRRKQAEALRKAGKLSDKAAERVKRGGRGPMLVSFAAAAGAPERPDRSSWGVQVLYVAYCFFCLIVLSSYTANLTSFLAVQRAAAGISGLADIVRDNLLISTIKGGILQAYFTSSHDSLALQVSPNVRYCEAIEDCVEWVRTGEVTAYVGDKPNLDYMAMQQPCDLTTVGTPFGPGNLVIGLQRNSSLTKMINKIIQSYEEDGTLSSLRRTWFDGLSQCDQEDAQLENSSLTISQMLGAFVFLALGILVAFFTGTIENLKWCLIRTNQTNEMDRGSDKSLRADLSATRRLSALLRPNRKSVNVGVDVEMYGQQNPLASHHEGPEADPLAAPTLVGMTTCGTNDRGGTTCFACGVAGAPGVPPPGSPRTLSGSLSDLATGSYGRLLAHPLLEVPGPNRDVRTRGQPEAKQFGEGGQEMGASVPAGEPMAAAAAVGPVGLRGIPGAAAFASSLKSAFAFAEASSRRSLEGRTPGEYGAGRPGGAAVRQAAMVPDTTAAAAQATSDLGSVLEPRTTTQPVIVSRRFRSRWNDEPPKSYAGSLVLEPAAGEPQLSPQSPRLPLRE